MTFVHFIPTKFYFCFLKLLIFQTEKMNEKITVLTINNFDSLDINKKNESTLEGSVSIDRKFVTTNEKKSKKQSKRNIGTSILVVHADDVLDIASKVCVFMYFVYQCN